MVTRLTEPSPKGDGIPFVRRVVTPEESLFAEIVSPCPEWICTHYDEETKRTSLCTQDLDPDGNPVGQITCEGHVRHLPERIKGYLCIWHFGQTRVEYLEITPYAWQQVKMRVVGITDLRGYRLNLKRQKGRKSRFEVSVMAVSGDYKPITPPPADMLERALKKMMRL